MSRPSLGVRPPFTNIPSPQKLPAGWPGGRAGPRDWGRKGRDLIRWPVKAGGNVPPHLSLAECNVSEGCWGGGGGRCGPCCTWFIPSLP